jgi:ribosome-associated toxin RatA of RatAB toxin-antitoxin module
MADESTQSIVIDAEPSAIMAVIADFEHYPVWAGSLKRAQVLATGPNGRAERVAFRLDAGMISDDYELAYTWSDDEQVRWTLVSGQLMRAQDGSYTLRPLGPGRTEVTYSLRVELTIPMLGMLRRKAERVVLDTALRELKKRVESGGAGTGEPA